MKRDSKQNMKRDSKHNMKRDSKQNMKRDSKQNMKRDSKQNMKRDSKHKSLKDLFFENLFLLDHLKLRQQYHQLLSPKAYSIITYRPRITLDRTTEELSKNKKRLDYIYT